MKYVCNVKEISYGHIEVEADNREEAMKQAKEIYELGDITWTDCEAEFETPQKENQRFSERGDAR